MAQKSFILDTNVLLHDPKAFLKFKNSKVWIPLVVIEELSALKRFNDEIGSIARHLLRVIDGLREKGDLRTGVAIENGVTLFLLGQGGGGDNEKLRLAHTLIEKGENVVFVSKDLVLRIKGEALGLVVEDYELPNMTYEDIYKGYRDIKVEESVIAEFLQKGFIVLPDEKMVPNEFCFIKSPAGGALLGKYNLSAKRIDLMPKFIKPIWGLMPRGKAQECALSLLLSPHIPLVTLMGMAGTGKTMLALAAGLKGVFEDNTYAKMIVTRPIMPLGKDIGYLPGTKEEKLVHWMQPIRDNLEVLCRFSSPKAADVQKTMNMVMQSPKFEMEAVTYIRGRTLPHTFMIIDEAQNLTPHEVKTLISRAGEGTKVVLTGDVTQIDHPYLDENTNALTYVVGKLYKSELFGQVLLEKSERSQLAALAADLL